MIRRRFAGALIVLVLVGCAAPVGGQSAVTVTRTVIAFEDTNANGSLDDGEARLPDVLILSDSNIHGTFERQARPTDAQGQVTITTTYTHYFDLRGVPPCGYTPTTPSKVSATRGRDEVLFGFAPQSPQPGTATVRFHLWDDQNANGVQDEGEPPVSGEWIAADVVLPEVLPSGSAPIPSYGQTNELAQQTDSEGRAEITLANSCGTIRLLAPYDTGWYTVSTQPPSSEPGDLLFEYGIGETTIEWALAQDS